VTPVSIVPVGEAEDDLWRLLREVSTLLRGLPWTLVGGLMVRVIEAEHSAITTWTTGDISTVLDVRALANATEAAAARLVEAGFEPQHYADGLTYRFIRAGDVVDVLAPDNVGPRASRVTVPPGETIEAIGSRAALNRRRLLVVDAGDGPFEIPIPSLLGAIVMKARVAGDVQNPVIAAKHERDLARLLALVADPVAARAELSTKERGYLAARAGLTRASHPAWRGVPGAEDGAIAFGVMTGAK
jgi:hypothetical protein